jgi:hypothetical protein
VLKQTNGEGVRQIVVNEETVRPRRVFELVSSVVTSTTTVNCHRQADTRLSDSSHQHSHLFGNRILTVIAGI